jgi:hypothetical protein
LCTLRQTKLLPAPATSHTTLTSQLCNCQPTPATLTSVPLTEQPALPSSREFSPAWVAYSHSWTAAMPFISTKAQPKQGKAIGRLHPSPPITAWKWERTGPVAEPTTPTGCSAHSGWQGPAFKHPPPPSLFQSGRGLPLRCLILLLLLLWLLLL